MVDRPVAGAWWRRRAPSWTAAAGAVLGAAAALGVAVAWVPFRTGTSNVVVALALVVVTTAAGATRRRGPVAGAAVAASAAFTFFDTQPYENFSIARPSDLVTALSLVVVGLLTGELALRVARNRRAETSAVADLVRVREAAALVADGEELVVLLGSVAAEIMAVAHLSDCWFSTEDLEAGTPFVDRDGGLTPAAAPPEQIALPVWALGQVVGHFLLVPHRDRPPRPDQLQVANILADQVGAALAAQTPLPPNPPVARTPASRTDAEPAPRLRVVHPADGEVVSRRWPGGCAPPARGTPIAG